MTTAATAGLVLYGPPAVGKTTIATRLAELDCRFAPFLVVKAGPGRTDGYTMISANEFVRRAAADDFVFTWERYDAYYAVSKRQLTMFADEGRVPIVQLGVVPAVQAVTAFSALRWIVVQLWANRKVCEDRVRNRGTGDLAARLAAYDQTVRLDSRQAQLTLDTDQVDEVDAARTIQAIVLNHPGGGH